MIYEKGLLKAMKELYKSCGYSVANEHGTLWIVSDSWYVGLRGNCISNDVKSLIVLHFGVMPGSGQAMKVHKGEDPQIVTVAVLLAEVQDMEDAEPEQEYRVTPVRLGDRVVFQDDRFLVRLAREADLLPMEYGNRTYLRDGNWLVQESADYFLAVLCYRGTEEEAGKIGLLEQMDWRD